MENFNERFRQVVFFILIAALSLLIFWQIKSTVPGILAAITLYVLNRKLLFKLYFRKKWNRTLVVLLLLFIDSLMLLVPIVLAAIFILPKLSYLTDNANELYAGLKEIIEKISTRFGIEILSKENLSNLPSIVSSVLPNFLGTAASGLTNLGVFYFILYYMLQYAEKMESVISKYIPLKNKNISMIASETKDIVTSYAIGIPILAVAQGICATIGYWIFGVENPVFWGFITALCSVIPFVGSALIWVPLVAYLYATNDTHHALFLAIYSVVVVLNVDNLLRIVLLKAFADIHPLITLFGVIVGLQLFGFLGLIFGPLLVSYLLLLMRIYVNEFADTETIN
ncbi:MAG TPA: AI-2E family transporter [Chitinophagales bacterium]|nr:AI-2E family transporter [Chitinophagales bacterium]